MPDGNVAHSQRKTFLAPYASVRLRAILVSLQGIVKPGTCSGRTPARLFNVPWGLRAEEQRIKTAVTTTRGYQAPDQEGQPFLSYPRAGKRAIDGCCL